MDFETRLELTETHWHDAQLCRLSYLLTDDGAEAVLELQLFATPQARDRHVRVWRFVNVHDLVLSANGPELQSHHGAGHVIQARLFESDRVDLNVYFCGAYLRLTADGLEDAADLSGGEAEGSDAAPSSKAMTAADAEAILDFTGNADWFDGRLRRLTFITGRKFTELVLDLDLPGATAAAAREARSYRFRAVKDVTVALNSAELRRQRVRDGNITQGCMNYGDRGETAPMDLSVITTGGIIRIAAKRLTRIAGSL